MNIEQKVALVFGTIGSIISYLVDGLGLAVVVLLGLMAIDYITGIIAAIIRKELNSRIGFTGLLKKIYYLLLLAAVYAIALIVPDIHFAGDGFAVALAVMELVSIAENGTKIDAPLTGYFKNILSMVKEKTGESGDKK